MYQADNIFNAVQDVADFSFDERTVAVFPDMIHRSIPAYASLLHLLAVVAHHHLPENGRVYDLGCALGGASIALWRQGLKNGEIIGLDASEAMIKNFQMYLENHQIDNVRAEYADITNYDYQPADVMILNFTLQFIDKNQRLDLLKRLKKALRPNGILIISEKCQMPEEMIIWHEKFKMAQGYSELAIAQKRSALENVMRLDTPEDLEKRLSEAGFSNVRRYHQSLSFFSWVAS